MKKGIKRETLLDHLGAERFTELLRITASDGGAAEIIKLLSIRVNK